MTWKKHIKIILFFLRKSCIFGWLQARNNMKHISVRIHIHCSMPKSVPSLEWCLFLGPSRSRGPKSIDDQRLADFPRKLLATKVSVDGCLLVERRSQFQLPAYTPQKNKCITTDWQTHTIATTSNTILSYCHDIEHDYLILPWHRTQFSQPELDGYMYHTV